VEIKISDRKQNSAYQVWTTRSTVWSHRTRQSQTGKTKGWIGIYRDCGNVDDSITLELMGTVCTEQRQLVTCW